MSCRCSLIVPGFDHQHAVRRCWRCLEQQSCPLERYEVIVVDGDDGCEPVIRSLARNAAATIARGQLLARSDDDRRAEPAWLPKPDRCPDAQPSGRIRRKTVKALPTHRCSTADQLIVDLVDAGDDVRSGCVSCLPSLTMALRNGLRFHLTLISCTWRRLRARNRPDRAGLLLALMLWQMVHRPGFLDAATLWAEGVPLAAE